MKLIIEYLIGCIYSFFSLRVKVTPFSRIDHKTSFEGHNRVGRNTILESIKIGKYSYIGNNCVLTNSVVGRYCSIASNVQLVSGTHPSSVFVSTHPVFYAKNTPVGKGFVPDDLFVEHKLIDGVHSLEIGNDVWIGSNVLLIQGVRIGNGAIIAAGSVVTKDVPPYSIVGGVPAKHIRCRFEESDVDFLNRTEWWNLSEDELVSNSRLFSDIKLLREKYEQS